MLSTLAVVSVVTAVVSPRSGAAPVSSDLLWQAAKVAAAASIQIIFMVFAPRSDRYPPAWALSSVTVSRGS